MAQVQVTIKAKFDGECPVCEQPTRKGDSISKYSGEWMHTNCVDGYDGISDSLLDQIERYHDLNYKGSGKIQRKRYANVALNSLRWAVSQAKEIYEHNRN